MVGIIALVSACKSPQRFEPVNADTAQTSSVFTDSTGSAKLIKTAELKFKVKDVQQTGEKIEALTTSYKGIVMHHETATEPQNSHDEHLSRDSVLRVTAQSISSQMTVKVPAERLEQFMDAVTKMGLYVTLRKMNIEDKTFNYLSAQMKLQSRNQLLAQQNTGKVVIKDPAAVLALKDDMIDEKVNNLMINTAVKYSTVELNFYQSIIINREVIANDDPAAYQLPFFSRMSLAFQNGWFLLTELIISITNLWAIIGIIVIIWFVIRWLYRRKLRLQHI